MNYSTHHNLGQREFDNRLYKRSNWREDTYKGLDSFSCRMPQMLTADNQQQLKHALWAAGIGQYDLEIVEGKGFKVHLCPEDFQSYLLLEINERARVRASLN